MKHDAIAPIKIGNNVYIGTDAMIMPGVTIGNNVIIGARAVVTRNINEGMVAVGVPAKEIETISQYYEHVKKKGRWENTVGLSIEEKRAYYEKKWLFRGNGG